MSSESRRRIIDRISKIMGFRLEEENLSPKLRKEIGEFAGWLAGWIITTMLRQ